MPVAHLQQMHYWCHKRTAMWIAAFEPSTIEFDFLNFENLYGTFTGKWKVQPDRTRRGLVHQKSHGYSANLNQLLYIVANGNVPHSILPLWTTVIANNMHHPFCSWTERVQEYIFQSRLVWYTNQLIHYDNNEHCWCTATAMQCWPLYYLCKADKAYIKSSHQIKAVGFAFAIVSSVQYTFKLTPSWWQW